MKKNPDCPDKEEAERLLGFLYTFADEENERIHAERQTRAEAQRGPAFLAACETLASPAMRNIFRSPRNGGTRPDEAIAALGLDGALNLAYDLHAMVEGAEVLERICKVVIMRLALDADKVNVAVVRTLATDEQENGDEKE